MATFITKLLKLTRLQARLPIVNTDGTGTTAFVDLINRSFTNIERQSNDNAAVLEQIGTLVNQIAMVLNIQTIQGQDIEALQRAAEQAVRDQALLSSYTDPTVTMSALSQPDGTVTVTIINHNRVYADTAKTTVPVTGATIAGLAFNTQYYVYYDDPERDGGTVNYQYTTDNTVAAQVGDRHSMGGIATGSAADTDPIDGGGVSPPGGGRVQPYRKPGLQEPLQPEQ